MLTQLSIVKTRLALSLLILNSTLPLALEAALEDRNSPGSTVGTAPVPQFGLYYEELDAGRQSFTSTAGKWTIACGTINLPSSHSIFALSGTIFAAMANRRRDTALRRRCG